MFIRHKTTPTALCFPIFLAMRILYFFICLVFVLFAGWQYNDPDPYIWIPIYGFVALTYGLAAWNRPLPFRVLLSGLAILFVFMLSYVPDVWHWIQMGEPSIVESMKAERPWVELTREGLGLMLCVGFLSWQTWLGRKQA